MSRLVLDLVDNVLELESKTPLLHRSGLPRSFNTTLRWLNYKKRMQKISGKFWLLSLPNWIAVSHKLRDALLLIYHEGNFEFNLMKQILTFIRTRSCNIESKLVFVLEGSWMGLCGLCKRVWVQAFVGYSVIGFLHCLGAGSKALSRMTQTPQETAEAISQWGWQFSRLHVQAAIAK